jgi:hypothetical protein
LRGQAQLLEPCDLRLGETAVGDVGERLSTPKVKRLLRPAIFDQESEAGEIELSVCDAEQVAGRLRLQAPTAEQLAHLGDVSLKRFVGGLRRLLVPERVDQAVGGDDLVRVHEQACEQRPLLGAAEVERFSFVEHFERAEDSEVHPCSLAWSGLSARVTATLARSCPAGQ